MAKKDNWSEVTLPAGLPDWMNVSSEAFVLFVQIATITALYGIINYKFISHNRHVGSLQLLSQENYHVSFKNKSPIDNKDLNKGYREKSFAKGDPKIFSPGNMLIQNGIVEE
jgi:hypothetical protein